MISILLGWLDSLIARILRREREDVRDWWTYNPKSKKYHE